MALISCQNRCRRYRKVTNFVLSNEPF